MNYKECNNYDIIGCFGKIYDIEECIRGFICCGCCDLTDECDFICDIYTEKYKQ